MGNLLIAKFQFDYLLSTFTGWDGTFGELRVIKKTDFNLNDFPCHDDIWRDDDLLSQYEELSKNCLDDEIVTYDYREATKEEILDYINNKILEGVCENFEEHPFCRPECPMYKFLLLRDIVLQRNLD